MRMLDVGQLVRIDSSGIDGIDNLSYMRRHFDGDNVTYDTVFIIIKIERDCYHVKLNNGYESKSVGAFATRFVPYVKLNLLDDSLFEV